MNETPDAQLVQQIARRRDRRAFVTLYDRYKIYIFNLAYRITRDRGMAEEAVQETFLRVWNMASRFSPSKGTFQNWFLRMAARECINLLRKDASASRARARNQEKIPEISSEAPHSQIAVQREELELLRHELDALPAEQQQMLALYFGANISQDEIGRELSIPQSTVSIKIKDALSRLRSSLTRAGLASGAAAIGEETFRATLFSGLQVPAALRERILKIPATSGRGSVGGLKRRLGVAAMAAFLLAAVVFMRTQTEAPGVQEQTAPSPKTKVAGVMPDLPLSWDFENGLPAELVVREGSVHPHSPSPFNSKGALASPAKAHIVLPVDVESEMVVSFQSLFRSDKKSPLSGLALAFSNASVDIGQLDIIEKKQLRALTFLIDGHPHKFELFADPKSCWFGLRVDGVPYGWINYACHDPSGRVPTNRLDLVLEGVIIDDLTVRAAQPLDLAFWQHHRQQESFNLFLQFEGWTMATAKAALLGSWKLVPGAGADGSGALELKGKPNNPAALFMSCGEKMKGQFVTLFDFCPLDDTALHPEGLFLRAYKSAPEKALKTFVRTLRPADRPAMRTVRKEGRYGKYERGRWYRASMIYGSVTTFLVVDGFPPLKIPSDPALTDVRFFGLWAFGRCRMDNVRIRIHRGSTEQYLEYLRQHGFSMKPQRTHP